MTAEGRFRVMLVDAWHGSPSEMGDAGTARLRDMLTIMLEERGPVHDGRLTESGRLLLDELRLGRRTLRVALGRAGGSI